MEKGTLYIVATPIGNLGDISSRAVETLQDVALIFAEDTRHSGKLLKHLSVTTPMQSLHEHNETARVDAVLAHLEKGLDVALISDAGTPLISDPGFALVREAHRRGFSISPIPGACALTSALSVAGLPTDCFQYVGFMPAKTSQRQRALQGLATLPHTLVFYETPHRITQFVEDAVSIMGADRQACLCRELTKRFETVKPGILSELHAWLQDTPEQCLGEFVVVIAGSPEEAIDDEEATRVLKILLAELPLKQAVKLATQLTGGHKNALYQQALLLSSS